MSESDDQMRQLERGFIVGGVVSAPIIMVVGIVLLTLGNPWAIWMLLPMIVFDGIFIVLLFRWNKREGKGNLDETIP
ncbi:MULTISPECIES: hypothetical protein [unclassified Cryobacterium]|uniref:hypothetical protein n=1 Tax=unclassified Cryobacterium TaxID=2649013 RepID=UPI0018CAF50D|nr:hypothetical protein [Cryobacterium sp. CAN_C3]